MVLSNGQASEIRQGLGLLLQHSGNAYCVEFEYEGKSSP